MNPFDLKAALLAPHAQHVVLIHFPIALFTMGVAFDVLARWRRNIALADAAFCNLLAAAISAVPALASGLLAWQWQLEGQVLRGTLRLHVLFASLASAMIWLVWWLHFRARRQTAQRVSTVLLIVEFAAVALVALTGHLGGFLSGVNGPG